MSDLGMMYEQGICVAKSIEKEFELYTQAANQGHACAQYNLGLLHAKGKGVDQSYELAREWWIKAALQDHEKALI